MLAPGEYHIYLNNSDFVTDTDDIPEISSLTMSPNPANQYIELSGEETEPVDISIYGPSGQLILRRPQTNLNDRIDVSQLNPGLYLVQVVHRLNTISTQELIIAR